MLANIIDNKHIYLEQVTPDIEQALIKTFSVRDPRAYYIETADWDGWYRRYDQKKQRLTLPFLDELKLCCGKYNIPLDIIDKRPAPTYPAPQKEQITETFLDNITLEKYQIGSLHACCDKEIGLISSCTGSGKTEIMCGLVKMFRCPTVIITEQLVILNQIIEKLQLRNVVFNNDIGLFCSGNRPDGNLVIVGSIDSLAVPQKPKRSDYKVYRNDAYKRLLKMLESEDPIIYKLLPSSVIDIISENPDSIQKIQGKYLQLIIDFCIDEKYNRRLKWCETRLTNVKKIIDLVSQCDLLLIDEADQASSDKYRNLFRNIFKGRRRYGLSGTPFDPKKPVRNLFLLERLGSIIYETDRGEVQANNRIIPIKCCFIGVGANGDRNDSRAYDIALKEEIIENINFHNLVTKICDKFKDEGTLILVDTAPIEPLGFALEELIPNSKFVYGKTHIDKREEYISAFESRELKCMIGSKIFIRGLDLKGGVENLIIIGGGASWSNFNQKIGRAVRINSRGWARVFCFFFLNNKYLYKHSKENLKAVINLGYKTTLAINGKQIDGKQFIKSNFRLNSLK